MQLDKTRCGLCGVRNNALGGRTKTGEFMLALRNEPGTGRAWPRIGTNGWCANADGEVERLTIVRISLARTLLNQVVAFLCQHCLGSHNASQGIFTDLFLQEA